MTLDRVQTSVLNGIAVAIAVTLVSFSGAYFWRSQAVLGATGTEHRLKIAALAALVISSTLVVSIARLAKHRFFTPQDIQGSALSSGTERAKSLQSLLQNTLEQVAVAVPVYFAVAIFFPANLIQEVLVGAALFLVGRVLFFGGYAKGAGSRAVGFGLTFYPTVILFVAAILFGVTLREA